MGKYFYKFIRTVGSAIFWVSSRPVVLHLDRARMKGPCILAANHHSPYDVAMMIRHTPVRLDFVSIHEVFRNPFVAWFYGSMDAFPIDRHKVDGVGVRTMLRRLRDNKVLAMFPEGVIKPPEKSVTNGGPIRPGIGKLAQMAGAPVVPCVVINSGAYWKLSAWLPIKAIRYGIIYGNPIVLKEDVDKRVATTQLEAELKTKLVELYRELADAMGMAKSEQADNNPHKASSTL
jgi:1-acyl-sn-glycerol-3-phosphate acyltransferase